MTFPDFAAIAGSGTTLKPSGRGRALSRPVSRNIPSIPGLTSAVLGYTGRPGLRAMMPNNEISARIGNPSRRNGWTLPGATPGALRGSRRELCPRCPGSSSRRRTSRRRTRIRPCRRPGCRCRGCASGPPRPAALTRRSRRSRRRPPWLARHFAHDVGWAGRLRDLLIMVVGWGRRQAGRGVGLVAVLVEGWSRAGRRWLGSGVAGTGP